VRGALLLSTQGGDIDKIIASERWAILRVFLVSAGVMLVLSLFLAGTIAEPMRKLAEAAERVRRGVRSRQEIPDFTDRADEIGHLSGALRDMTRTLYNRIEAIESFAADVSHELKNPLTSLRSAVETLPRVKKDEQRARLLDIIQHDVKRLDRLITDISDASRLDAELARSDLQLFDLSALTQAIVAGANQVDRGDGVTVRLTALPGDAPRERAFQIQGNDLRLGQVLTNLIDNARSFTPENGEVRVILRRAKTPADRQTMIELVVERIFERFYTDRPTQNFGQNSGLGLSISRQIVEAHGGTIEAQNRCADGRAHDGAGPDDSGFEPIAGARFIVRLKAAA